MAAPIPVYRLIVPVNVWRPGRAVEPRPIDDTSVRIVEIVVELHGVQFYLLILANGLAETKLASSRLADVAIDVANKQFMTLHLKHNYLLEGELARPLSLPVYDGDTIQDVQNDSSEEERKVTN